MDAVATAAAVRSGRASATELVEASLARIDEHDGQVNAFTVVLGEQARARAAEIDALSPADRARLGPLAGVPVSVKDHVWLAGAPATNGSAALRDHVPAESARCVDRLVAAGAVVVGKTNNPEFCYRGYTDNEVYGLTRNPWSPDRTPGGSSGGAGASVAYGATPIAVGTDGGGSIRIPAAFCGVVGHKPTFDRVPTRPGFRGWPTLSVHGPLTSTVRDAALALHVLDGSAPVDLAPVDLPPVDWSSLRVAVSEDLGWAPVEPVVRSAFRAAVDALSSDGARVEAAHPTSAYPTELWNAIALPEGFASEGPLLDDPDRGPLIDPVTRDIVEAGRGVSARDYLDAQEQRRAFVAAWESFFDDHDVLLAPSMPLPAFSCDVSGPTHIDGVAVDPLFDDWCVLALPANLTGQPACAVPTGLDPDGLPVGLQVIGPRGADERVLAVAAALERVRPWPLLGDRR